MGVSGHGDELVHSVKSLENGTKNGRSRTLALISTVNSNAVSMLMRHISNETLIHDEKS